MYECIDLPHYHKQVHLTPLSVNTTNISGTYNIDTIYDLTDILVKREVEETSNIYGQRSMYNEAA